MTIVKKSPKNLPCEVIGTHRTISELKPVGKQMPINKEKGNRRTATAFSKKKSLLEKEKAKEKTWYMLKGRDKSSEDRNEEDEKVESERRNEK